jgi:hypothetical protein
VAPLRLQGSKYEMLETQKDGIKFTSEALRQAATQLQTFSGQYESRQGHLVEQVHPTGAALKFVTVMESAVGRLLQHLVF